MSKYDYLSTRSRKRRKLAVVPCTLTLMSQEQQTLERNDVWMLKQGIVQQQADQRAPRDQPM